MFTHYLDLSWRSFKRTPLVSILMVLAIAIGIGVTMTSLSVYHMMSMDPIPSKSQQLFHPQLKTMDEGINWWTSNDMPTQLTYQDAVNLQKAEVPAKKSISMRSGFSVHLGDGSIKPFMSQARFINADFFSMFQLEFVFGDSWSLAQEHNATPVLVIDSQLNDKLFAGTNSVGKQLYLDDKAFLIVGVIKQWTTHIKYYDLNNGAFNETENIYMPFPLVEANQYENWGNTNGWKHESIRTFEEKIRSEHVWLQFWVELPTRDAKKDYGEFLLAYMQEQQKIGRFNRKELDFALHNVTEWMEFNNVVSEDNKVMVALSFMFLAVCLANILGLLLAKFLRRAPEIGVRRALGASKTQVFYQHLVEVSLLGLFGGLLGILVAQLGLWGVRITRDYYENLATMDITMLLAAPAIAIVACLVAGLYPAWLVCRTNPAVYLKSQ
ncbi:ABC transporter ATP-binding protein [Pseudoalteromonas luteoviolacea B = ATCC 29581]|nr:ABC transporter ATP-binding protein [Pseudoalteromonas luteoviolacea B = ATCC 29581]